jgi:hypothetical protein
MRRAFLLLIALLFAATAHASGIYNKAANGIGQIDGINNFSASGGGFDPSCTAIFTAFTTPPTGPRKTLICNTVTSLKTAGVWTLFDGLWMFAAADSQAATINWVNPTGTAAAPTNSPSFTTDRGFAGDGTTSFVNTNFTPSAGVNFTQTNAHFSIWDLTNRATNATQHGVSQTGSSPTAIGPFTFSSRLNDSVGTSPSTTVSNGHFLVSKTTGTIRNNYFNGSALNNGTGAVSGTRASIPIWIGGVNSNSALISGSTDQISMASVGAALTSTQETAFYNTLLAYMQGVGAVSGGPSLDFSISTNSQYIGLL